MFVSGTGCSPLSQSAGKHLSGSGGQARIPFHHARMPLCSVTLLGEVGGHFRDELPALLSVLVSTDAVLLVLLPVGHNDGGLGLSDGGTTTGGVELGGASGLVVVREHVLETTEADSSLRGLPVVVRGGEGAVDFVDFDVGLTAIEVLDLVLVGGEIAATLGRVGPERTIVSID